MVKTVMENNYEFAELDPDSVSEIRRLEAQLSQGSQREIKLIAYSRDSKQHLNGCRPGLDD